MGGLGQFFPKSVAQLAGVIVAGIVAVGTDTDIFMAVPLGVFAGALATLFVSMSDARSADNERWEDRSPYDRRPRPRSEIKPRSGIKPRRET
jgi:hypothetical protein